MVRADHFDTSYCRNGFSNSSRSRNLAQILTEQVLPTKVKRSLLRSFLLVVYHKTRMSPHQKSPHTLSYIHEELTHFDYLYKFPWLLGEDATAHLLPTRAEQRNLRQVPSAAAASSTDGTPSGHWCSRVWHSSPPTSRHSPSPLSARFTTAFWAKPCLFFFHIKVNESITPNLMTVFEKKK